MVDNITAYNLAQIEKLHIVHTLQLFGGNVSQTAKALGIGVRTLQRKLKAWNVDKAFFKHTKETK